MNDENTQKFIDSLIYIIAIAIYSAMLWLIWNWIFPDIFSLPKLNFWQAVGITILFQEFSRFGRKDWKRL